MRSALLSAPDPMLVAPIRQHRALAADADDENLDKDNTNAESASATSPLQMRWEGASGTLPLPFGPLLKYGNNAFH
jgi:hypothetical protein